MNRYEEAIADYDEAIRLNPQEAKPYHNRGNAEAGLDCYDAAIADYDEAILMDPDFAEAYISRGLVRSELACKDQARKDCQTALKLAQNAKDEDLVVEAQQALNYLDGGTPLWYVN